MELDRAIALAQTDRNIRRIELRNSSNFMKTLCEAFETLSFA